MSNIQFIDGTVRVGDICNLSEPAYAVIQLYVSQQRLKFAVDYLVLKFGYSPAIAELIVYELI